MRNPGALCIPLMALLLPGHPAASQTPRAPQARQSFDGSWIVVLTCPAATDGARGYTYRFPAQVRDGRLRGQNGTEGSVGWLVLDGAIQPDGTALLTANGVTGNPDFSVGRVRQLTPYSYQVNARFEATRGSGRRVETRACDFDFTKQ